MDRRHFFTLAVSTLTTASAGCLDSVGFESDTPTVEPLPESFEDSRFEEFPEDLLGAFPDLERGHPDRMEQGIDRSAALALRIGEEVGEAFGYIVVLASDADGVETTLRVSFEDSGRFRDDITVVSEETVELSQTEGVIYLPLHPADYELTLETKDRTESRENLRIDAPNWSAEFIYLTDDEIKSWSQGGNMEADVNST